MTPPIQLSSTLEAMGYLRMLHDTTEIKLPGYRDSRDSFSPSVIAVETITGSHPNTFAAHCMRWDWTARDLIPVIGHYFLLRRFAELCEKPDISNVVIQFDKPKNELGIAPLIDEKCEVSFELGDGTVIYLHADIITGESDFQFPFRYERFTVEPSGTLSDAWNLAKDKEEEVNGYLEIEDWIFNHGLDLLKEAVTGLILDHWLPRLRETATLRIKEWTDITSLLRFINLEDQ